MLLGVMADSLLYFKYLIIFVIGVLIGRLTMALQYAFMKKSAAELRDKHLAEEKMRKKSAKSKKKR